jgi:hypothetical protein
LASLSGACGKRACYFKIGKKRGTVCNRCIGTPSFLLISSEGMIEKISKNYTLYACQKWARLVKENEWIKKKPLSQRVRQKSELQ